jgi:phosphatidylserine/phosphatidylglycerophosphate/cardiolipin synthase-like enzyme
MLAASGPSADAARRLGRFLTGTEAGDVAARLAEGSTLTAALRTVAPARRQQVRTLLDDAGVSGSTAVAVLRAIQGARSTSTRVEPVWTMPGHQAGAGPLTTSITTLAANARQSVTCSTYNLQRSSVMWDALRGAASRPEIALRLYLDTRAADSGRRSRGTPTTAEVAAHLHPGAVLRTTTFDGKPVRNHAKFLAVDHRFLLVTSANLSWSAEFGNVELGVRMDDRALTEAVERQLRDAEGVFYEQVTPPAIGRPSPRE